MTAGWDIQPVEAADIPVSVYTLLRWHFYRRHRPDLGQSHREFVRRLVRIIRIERERRAA